MFCACYIFCWKHPHNPNFGHCCSMLVPLNDNLNSFSPPPAPSFGQMLRHLSKGLRRGGGRENLDSTVENVLLIAFIIRPSLDQKLVIRFQKLLFPLRHATSASILQMQKFIWACPLRISFCKLPKTFPQWKMTLKKYAPRSIFDRQTFLSMTIELKLTVFVLRY